MKKIYVVAFAGLMFYSAHLTQGAFAQTGNASGQAAAAANADPAYRGVQGEIKVLIFQGGDVKELNLHGRNLKALPPPPEIGQLKNLEKLLLAGNQLTTLPPEIGQLKNLKEIEVQANHLTAIPPEIGQLKNLEKLWLSNNQLTTLPSEMGQLENLTKLGVDNNQLTTLPPEVGQLKNLTDLWVENNFITSLPSSFNRPGLTINGFKGKFEDAKDVKGPEVTTEKTPEQMGAEQGKVEAEKVREGSDEEVFQKWLNEK